MNRARAAASSLPPSLLAPPSFLARLAVSSPPLPSPFDSSHPHHASLPPPSRTPVAPGCARPAWSMGSLAQRGPTHMKRRPPPRASGYARPARAPGSLARREMKRRPSYGPPDMHALRGPWGAWRSGDLRRWERGPPSPRICTPLRGLGESGEAGAYPDEKKPNPGTPDLHALRGHRGSGAAGAYADEKEAPHPHPWEPGSARPAWGLRD